jgi:hypothetical protein
MRGFLGVLFVICVSLAAVGQDKQPTLDETIKWMDQTFNGGHRGLFQQWDSKGKLMTEYTNSFTLNQCKITIEFQEPFGDAEETKNVWTQSETLTFSLGDIDPTTVKVIPHDSKYMSDCTNKDEVAAFELSCTEQAEVTFSTRNEAPLINGSAHTVFPKIKGPDHDSYPKGTQSSASLGMFDAVYGERFGKAFHHAVELCGGKPSIF